MKIKPCYKFNKFRIAAATGKNKITPHLVLLFHSLFIYITAECYLRQTNKKVFDRNLRFHSFKILNIPFQGSKGVKPTVFGSSSFDGISPNQRIRKKLSKKDLVYAK